MPKILHFPGQGCPAGGLDRNPPGGRAPDRGALLLCQPIPRAFELGEHRQNGEVGRVAVGFEIAGALGAGALEELQSVGQSGLHESLLPTRSAVKAREDSQDHLVEKNDHEEYLLRLAAIPQTTHGAAALSYLDCLTSRRARALGYPAGGRGLNRELVTLQ